MMQAFFETIVRLCFVLFTGVTAFSPAILWRYEKWFFSRGTPSDFHLFMIRVVSAVLFFIFLLVLFQQF